MAHYKNNLILNIAGVLIILAALKIASDLVVPILLALFVSFSMLPLVDRFNEKVVPRTVSSALILLLLTTSVVYLSGFLSQSFSDFSSNSSTIMQGLQDLIEKVEAALSRYGLATNLSDHINIKSAYSAGINLVGKLGGVMSKTFLVLLMSYFMLIEAPRWQKKIENIIKKDNTNAILAKQIKAYLGVKLLTSSVTGLLIALGLYFIGHQYWILWGFCAFFLNFIPNIGSVLAAIPAIIVSFITMGQIDVLFTIILYVITNVVIGSFVEPKIIGRTLGISTLVILTSMLWWGWMFGVTGMFLSVPITVSIKILIDAKTPNNKLSLLLAD